MENSICDFKTNLFGLRREISDSREIADLMIENFIQKELEPKWQRKINLFFEETTGITMAMAESFLMKMNELKQSSLDDQKRFMNW